MLNRIGKALLGDLPAFSAAPIEFAERVALGVDRPVSLRFGPKSALLVATPSAVRHVLVDRRDNYGKGAEQARLRPILGEGLITSSGEKWDATRQALKLSFSAAGLNRGLQLAFTTLFGEAARLTMRTGYALDLHEVMGRLTMRMVVAALFEERLDDADADMVYHCGKTAHSRLTESMWRLVDHDMLLPTAKHREFKQAVANLDGLVDRFTREPKGPLAALQPLCHRYGEAVLRDEAVTMLVAGFETTAMAASWLAYALADHPDLVEWLRPEVDGAMQGDWGLDPTKLKDMPRTRALVQEVLRLYPSTWWIARAALADDEIDGVPVKKGSSILICPWVLHRQPSCWENPGRLDPLRFLHKGATDKFAYMPFGVGPRVCVGAQLAMAELMGIAAMLVSVFEVRPLSGPLNSLRPVGGVTLAPPAKGLSVGLSVRQLTKVAA